ncbi:hypothetical protein ASPNIDRAFT_184254, partial [Aspergillus niger ATCC 1015]
MSHATGFPTSVAPPLHASRISLEGCSSSNSAMEPLEVYDKGDSYVKAKSTLSHDAAFAKSSETCHLLCHNIMSLLIERTEVVRKVDSFYYGGTRELQPGVVLRITAHRRKKVQEQESWVQADVSLTNGTLLASAHALCVSHPGQNTRIRSLASPISFAHENNAAKDFSFPFA